MTVTRMATATRLIPMTVGIFDTPKQDESSKTITVTRMVTATRLIPVLVDIFDMPKKDGSSKTITITRMATAIRLILVTVDIFDTPETDGSWKPMIITRMATATRLIPVTVDIVDTSEEDKSSISFFNNDNYEDGDRDLPDTCDCWQPTTHALRSKGGAERAEQKPNELSGVGAPPAAKLEGEDNEAAARGAEKRGVRALLGKAGVLKGSPAESACVGAGAAKAVERGHSGGVDGTLDSSPHSPRGGGHLGDRQGH